jgi:hypothetical protein
MDAAAASLQGCFLTIDLSASAPQNAEDCAPQVCEAARGQGGSQGAVNATVRVLLFCFLSVAADRRLPIPPTPSQLLYAYTQGRSSRQHRKRLEQLKNLSVAAWGAGAACCGQRVQHIRLKEAGAAAAAAAAAAATTTLHLFLEPDAHDTLLVVVIPSLEPGHQADDKQQQDSQQQHQTAAKLRAAAGWMLDTLRFLVAGDGLSAMARLPGAAAALDRCLGQAFERVAAITAGGGCGGTAGRALLFGPHRLQLPPQLQAEIDRRLQSLNVIAPQWLMDFSPGANASSCHCCLFAGCVFLSWQSWPLSQTRPSVRTHART